MVEGVGREGFPGRRKRIRSYLLQDSANVLIKERRQDLAAGWWKKSPHSTARLVDTTKRNRKRRPVSVTELISLSIIGVYGDMFSTFTSRGKRRSSVFTCTEPIFVRYVPWRAPL